MGDLRLADLLDLAVLQRMADAHYRSAGIPTGIVDAIDGSILVGSGWQDICTKFHRAGSASLENCRESDTFIKDRLVQGEAYRYKCKNGLWDIGMPIVVEGRHLATLFLGQFFYEGEVPDRDFFISQGQKFQFDIDKYLEALDRVPRFSRAKVDTILEYDKALVAFICDLAKQSLRKNEDMAEQKQAERERLANLHYFESMDRINQAMHGAQDLDQTMSNVLDEMLEIFKCDRAWLLYPCDPESPTWRVPMERTRPEYPGAFELKTELPMGVDGLHYVRAALAAKGPVAFGPGCEQPLLGDIHETFLYQSQIMMAIYPKVDKAWLLGMHQCSYARQWSRQDKRLFQEIGRRMGDTLNSLLMYRNLHNSEAKTRSILENIGLGVTLISPDMEILEMNRRIQEWFPGIDLSRRHICYEAFNDPPGAEICSYCPTSKTLRDGLVHEATTQTPHPDGVRNYRLVSSPIVNADGEVVAAIEIAEDITEKLSLEAQLQQAQKMESVGRLAGGVAHDFNNLLGVVIGHTELALEQMKPTEALYTPLQDIQNAAHRSAELTRQLLAFARQQTVVPKVLDLNSTVEGMLKMLRRLIGEDVDLVWQPDSNLWPVKMDPSQIDQILANLCLNARDAIASVGEISIKTQRVTFDDAYCANNPGYTPGHFVRLEVSDNGQGMDKETQGKIFEPFFTTKQIGKGTGLGLATVYGIVQQNKGFLNVSTEQSQGSTFEIYLPRHLEESQQAPAKRTTAPDPGGDETILVVEDEAPILKITRLILERLGYHIMTASSPEEALRLASEVKDKIDLLLTDVVMPGMNGKELAEEMLSMNPGLKSLFMSGYTNNIIVHHGILEDGIDHIQKPFSMQDLAVKVREVLDS